MGGNSACKGGKAPWKNADELYTTIDQIQLGDTPWHSSTIRYRGPLPAGTPPKWMTETYELFFRDARLLLQQQFKTFDFKDAIDLVPYQQFNKAGKRVFTNLMSGDWAWRQAVCLHFNHYEHPTYALSGYNRRGPCHSRGNVHTNCGRERQDYCFGCYGASTISSGVYVTWECYQYGAQSTW